MNFIHPDWQKRVKAWRRAEAPRASDKDLGEVQLDFVRGKNGKISSPVRVTDNAGTYEMSFERGADGRMSRTTLKPRQ